jgi:hypothetical protein
VQIAHNRKFESLHQVEIHTLHPADELMCVGSRIWRLRDGFVLGVIDGGGGCSLHRLSREERQWMTMTMSAPRVSGVAHGHCPARSSQLLGGCHEAAVTKMGDDACAPRETHGADMVMIDVFHPSTFPHRAWELMDVSLKSITIGSWLPKSEYSDCWESWLIGAVGTSGGATVLEGPHA